MSANPYVKEAGAQDFRQKVLERSASVPVVVDFWAPWCGPCRVLGPLLEREVAALGGRVEMVKVNTDDNPELSYEYGIQGIPAVKAFKDGKVVAEFVGAQPAPQVQKFLKALAPPPGLGAIEQAEAAVRAGRLDEAEAGFRGLLDDATVGGRARLGLARALAASGRGAEARAELGKIDPRSPEAEAVPTVERQLAFAEDAAAYGGEEKARAAVAQDGEGKDLEARYALASALAARGAYQEALEQFLEIVGRNRKLHDDGARLAMLTIFDLLGPTHDLVGEYRRRLQIVL